MEYLVVKWLHVLSSTLMFGTGIGSAMPRKDGKRTSHGLLGIRERALAMGGVCTIGDGPGGRGTEVRVRIPVAKLKAAA